jgi:hypothetical protein
MNIFALHLNPQLAAEYHCDKHVVKMIIETAQLLYCAHYELDSELFKKGYIMLPNNAYRKTHPNHPCAIWVRQNIENYTWLTKLGWFLCKEYQTRYGEHKIHKTEKHIRWLMKNPPICIPNGDRTPFPQAMPPEYKRDDSIEAYRTYYKESKMKIRKIVKYTRRPPPAFLL